ncbi:MAG TPA: ion channel [Gemmatimonadales bacterium]|nr:ion channel [Gemmatimonadales bacterium]
MTAVPPPAAPGGADDSRDLGFGAVVTRESRLRLLNRDGTFNVRRRGLGFFESLSAYHTLLTLSWPRFLLLVVAAYFAANLVFAGAYLLCGPGGLTGPMVGDSHLLQAFFFSVETIGTIGYGQIAPASTAANIVMTTESVSGLVGLAIVTGLLFARFSRPIAAILFSRWALIAPYRGITAFEFRIANRHKNELVELDAKLLYSRTRDRGGRRMREFLELGLERRTVVFFPLTWTVVHPIDETSPLKDVTQEQLVAEDAEFLVLLQGTDETFAQRVHARSSYKPHEIVWHARFTDVFQPPGPEGMLAVDVGRLHEFERLVAPGASRGDL